MSWPHWPRACSQGEPGFAALSVRALAVLGAYRSGNQPAVLLRTAQLCPSATDLSTVLSELQSWACMSQLRACLVSGIPNSHASHPNLALRSSVEAAMRQTLDGECSGTAWPAAVPLPRGRVGPGCLWLQPLQAACNGRAAMQEPNRLARLPYVGLLHSTHSCTFNPSSTSLTLSPTLLPASPQDMDPPSSSQPHSTRVAVQPPP